MKNNDTTLAQPHDKIRDLITSDRFRYAVGAALPTHLKPDRFVRVALTALTRTPKLSECDQASFFQCLLTLSQLGLEPDGRNAHLIPFENRKRGVVECQLIIDYKGLVDLAMRSGKLASIHADKVCANDVFEYDRGEITKHQIDFRKPRGEAYAYYAIARFTDPTSVPKCEVMAKEDVDKIRQRSRAKEYGPWVTDYDEMAKKTVFRRLSKWLQLSPEYRDALEIDADKLEEHRFESAMPVIESPVFEQPKMVEDKPKNKGGRPRKEQTAPPQDQKMSEVLEPPAETETPKLKKLEPATPFESEPTGGDQMREAVANRHPFAYEIEKRLDDSNFSVLNLYNVAVANKWVTQLPTPPTTVAQMADEEKCETFLDKDNWKLIMGALEKLNQ
jgi:recombination protein RecT